MARRRGNPNWGKASVGSIPQLPTAFEEEVRKLGLTTSTYAMSAQLKRWCERNKDRCYIPEHLLKSWGISAEGNWSE
jgi:hypothetical protein